MIFSRSRRVKWLAPRSWYGTLFFSMWKAAVSIEEATARMTSFGAAPRAQAVELSLQVGVLGTHRRPSSADQVVLSQGAPLRTRVERRFPALSSLRGQNPAQERR